MTFFFPGDDFISGISNLYTVMKNHLARKATTNSYSDLEKEVTGNIC
jgi:hypothetical protein